MAFFAFKYDVRSARRGELDRLRVLGLRFAELGTGPSRRAFDRLLDDFVDEEPRSRLRARLGSGAPHPALSMERWVRADAVRSRTERSSIGWLTRLGRETEIVRIERRAGLPAVRIVASTLHDTWAESWPGIFVNFEAGRALVITLDYEDVRCDLRAGTSAYR